jgi:hypothetical protein
MASDIGSDERAMTAPQQQPQSFFFFFFYT